METQRFVFVSTEPFLSRCREVTCGRSLQNVVADWRDDEHGALHDGHASRVNYANNQLHNLRDAWGMHSGLQLAVERRTVGYFSKLLPNRHSGDASCGGR